MNEMCKYCKTAGTCLEMVEYNSIYCTLHRRIPRVIGKTYEELEQENQKLKQEISNLKILIVCMRYGLGLNEEQIDLLEKVLHENI